MESKKTGRPKKYTDPNEMQKRIDIYFADCDSRNEPYTMTGLSISLDLDRDTLLRYGKTEAFYFTIKKAREKVVNSIEKKLITEANPTGKIFWLKNNANWRDTQDQNISITQIPAIVIEKK